MLPDLSYVTAAEIGRPFRTRWAEVPDRPARTTSMRKQFADGEVTRSKKLEGAWGDEEGLYFVASFAFATGDLPANATKHDGQLWYLRYSDSTLTLFGYCPYNDVLHLETPDWDTARAEPGPRLRRPGRVPRLAVREPDPHRGRQRPTTC